MLCDKCKKNEATITLTETVNGEVNEYNLCGSCAAETQWGQIFEPEFLSQILTGMLGAAAKQFYEPKEEAYDKIICPVCHTGYNDFVKNSRFGCPECYQTFGILMKKSIRDLQGSDHHVGKHPKYQNIATQNMTADLTMVPAGKQDGNEDTNSSVLSDESFEFAKSELGAEAMQDNQESAKKSKLKTGELTQNEIGESEASIKELLALYRSRLQEALAEEDYDAAAYYRDEIKKLS